ncbi:hypothetical protein D3C71_1014050 [compost metagenome]
MRMQAAPRHVEVAAVVLVADVFEHAHREDRIEGLVDVVVILQADLDGQASAQLACVVGLLLRDGDAHPGHAIALGRELQRLAPAAADIQYVLTGAQAELAADQVELGLLRRVQVQRVAPVATTVDQALAEHGLVQVVAQVVMAPPHLQAAAAGLQVEQARLERVGQFAPAVHALVEVGLHQLVQKAIQRSGVPLAVHVALAQAERAVGHDPRIELRVMHVEVVGLVTVDGDARLVQQQRHSSLQSRVHTASVDQPWANNPA